MNPLWTSFAITGATSSLLAGATTFSRHEQLEDTPGGFEQGDRRGDLERIAAMSFSTLAVGAGAIMSLRGGNQQVSQALIGSGGGIMFGTLVGQIVGGAASLAKD